MTILNAAGPLQYLLAPLSCAFLLKFGINGTQTLQVKIVSLTSNMYLILR